MKVGNYDVDAAIAAASKRIMASVLKRLVYATAGREAGRDNNRSAGQLWRWAKHREEL